MAILSKIVEGLTNNEEYFARVFAVNPKGRVNNRVDLPWASAIPSAFPQEPTAYELIDKYTTSFTFVAPENGYFRFELHGTSGAGGTYNSGERNENDSDGDEIIGYFAMGGGGGQSGGYCSSNVEMLKDDIAIITIGDTCTIEIFSTRAEYSAMSVTKGANGTKGSMKWEWDDDVCHPRLVSNGVGGSGGAIATGGEVNINGNPGNAGTSQFASDWNSKYMTGNSGAGGAAVHENGNVGGKGAGVKQNNSTTTIINGAEASKLGFVKIYRGNTNVA